MYTHQSTFGSKHITLIEKPIAVNLFFSLVVFKNGRESLRISDQCTTPTVLSVETAFWKRSVGLSPIPDSFIAFAVSFDARQALENGARSLCHIPNLAVGQLKALCNNWHRRRAELTHASIARSRLHSDRHRYNHGYCAAIARDRGKDGLALVMARGRHVDGRCWQLCYGWPAQQSTSSAFL